MRTGELAPDHWMVASSQSTLGECLTKLARFGEAEPLLLTSADTLEKTLGPTHPRTLQAFGAVVSLYEAWKKPEEAAPYRARASQPNQSSP